MNTVTDTTMWEGSLHAGSIGSFLNKPRVACKADALRAAGATVAFLGFPWDGTCISRTGTNMGPKGLREASEQFLTFNANTGMDLEQLFTIVDAGDVSIVPGNSVSTQQRAEDMVAEILAADAIPVIGGGDHSITIGPARAFARKYRRCGMIHFDTHLDTAQDVGGETLNHCCPIARALDAGFRPQNIVTIGPSGWMNPRSELAYVKDKGINLFTLEDVWELGVPEVAARAVALASKDVDAVYLTIDIDVLDASQAPGTGVPTPCGMTARELLGIITRLKGAPIRAIDLAEVSPPWDPSGITSRLGMRILLDSLATASASR